jgi:hypothetical protein
MRVLAVGALAAVLQVSGCETMTPAVSDYCTRYQRQVLTKAEVAQIKQLDQSLRRRIQGNDLDYLCNCVGWSDPICVRARRSQQS